MLSIIASNISIQVSTLSLNVSSIIILFADDDGLFLGPVAHPEHLCYATDLSILLQSVYVFVVYVMLNCLQH